MSDMASKKSNEAASDVAVYIVLDETNGGNVYREVHQAEAGENNVIENIVQGKYLHPVRIVAFNVGRQWARDVTVDIAQAVLKHSRSRHQPLSPSAELFVETVLGQNASMRALS